MSLAHPAMKQQPTGLRPVDLPAGPYGVPDIMLHGLNHAKKNRIVAHPLQYSEEHYEKNKHQLDEVMLRNLQGIHAPLRLQMERNIASKFQRLPGLTSSNVLYDTLTGKDETIDFEDIFNDPANCEKIGQPHVLMEKRLNIL
ncbi:proteasome maturation protein-like isoform X2 [Gigantopelta aegis]|uniref:proteasome maturation protein-like isoform X2 n=1 Tax=Gigantopelta aegis TaxID=1735272 RepID=UPI001B8876FD|nr:proteasome maturation protein-like isoform X2 [Gigantopelta aegis]